MARRSPVAVGSVQRSMWPNRDWETGDFRRPAVQTPLESDVHATERPAPYDQAASTGSCLGEVKYTSDAGLGVDTTYPPSCGKASRGTPSRRLPAAVTLGKNGSCSNQGRSDTWASFRKRSGTCEGLFDW